MFDPLVIVQTSGPVWAVHGGQAVEALSRVVHKVVCGDHMGHAQEALQFVDFAGWLAYKV